MRINIVTVRSGWILQKIAERTANAARVPGVEVTVSHRADLHADVNYYVDMYNCYHGEKTECDIGYFTHAHENSPEWLEEMMDKTTAWQMEGIVSMNERYTQMLRDIGYTGKLATITPGQTFDTFPLKKKTLGIVSRGGWEGYGQQFMEQLLSTYDFKSFNLRFLGDGWDALLPIAEARGIQIELFDDATHPYSSYPDFYRTIDYLLIPGMWTAGPMSMQEALSCGVPVIAADVGFVGYEFEADCVFEPGDVFGLIRILDEIEAPLLRRRAQVNKMSWEKHATDVINFIKQVQKEDDIS